MEHVSDIRNKAQSVMTDQSNKESEMVSKVDSSFHMTLAE